MSVLRERMQKDALSAHLAHSIIMSYYTAYMNMIWSIGAASYPPQAACIPTLISSIACLLADHNHIEAGRQV